MSQQTKRRLFQRLPCDLPLTLGDPKTGDFLAAGRFVDIGVGGGAIETEMDLSRDAVYTIRWTWRHQAMEIPAHVAWEGGRDPRTGSSRYGIIFNRTTKLHHQLKDMIDHVRSQLWMSDARTAREFWKV